MSERFVGGLSIKRLLRAGICPQCFRPLEPIAQTPPFIGAQHERDPDGRAIRCPVTGGRFFWLGPRREP